MSCCDCYKLRIRDSTWRLAQKIWQRSESFQRYKESMKPLDCNCRTKESSKNFLGSLSFALGILLARSSKTDCIASTVVSGTILPIEFPRQKTASRENFLMIPSC